MIFNYQKPIENLCLSDLFKEIYQYSYTEKEKAEIRLIERYWKVLPYKLIRKYNDVKIRAKQRRSDEFREELLRPNPFLAMFKKDETWSGGYFPIPLSLHK